MRLVPFRRRGTEYHPPHIRGDPLIPNRYHLLGLLGHVARVTSLGLGQMDSCYQDDSIHQQIGGQEKMTKHMIRKIMKAKKRLK